VFNIWPLDVDLRALYMAFRRRLTCAIYDLQTWTWHVLYMTFRRGWTWRVLYMTFRRRLGVCYIWPLDVDVVCVVYVYQVSI